MLCVTCNVAKLIFISWPPDLWQKFNNFILLFEKEQCDYTRVATYLLLLSRPVKKSKAVAEFLHFVETWVLSSALGSFHKAKLYNGYCGFQIGKLYCLMRWSKYLGENWMSWWFWSKISVQNLYLWLQSPSYSPKPSPLHK